MNRYLTLSFTLLLFTQAYSQNTSLLDKTKRWILLNNKIDKNEVFLTSYSKSKLKADTFVMHLGKDGKIEYDYETNPAVKASGSTYFLDIDTDESAWEYNPAAQTISLTIKGGYSSLDDFKFKREYKITSVTGGYVLHVVNEQYYEDLKNNLVRGTLKVKTQEQAIPSTAVATARPGFVAVPVKIAEELPKEASQEEVALVKPVIDYVAQSKAMLIDSKRWILLGNKITKNVIKLTPFDVSKFRINTLVLSFGKNGKIQYDYESDPTIEFCAGIEFLDIDTDESSWVFDAENNLLTLIIKGGYASLDDFKFKREYKIEQRDDEYVLHKTKEYYFVDLKKQNQVSRKKSD